ncbi:MAG: hypothetical protein ABIE36_01300 [Candidatus Diapherotrites archaeon]
MAGEYYEVEVGGKPKVVEYPDKVETGGISGCMGVGILNHKTKKGYLGHYIAEDKTSKSLINRAIHEAQNISDLEVALAGNIPLNKEAAKDSEGDFDDRLKICRAHGKWAFEMVKLKGINIKNIKNYLQKNPSEDSYEIFIDTELGIMEVNKEEFDDLS